MIKILRLTKKDRELFLDMDPLSLMERLEFPGAFALAAVETHGNTEGESPAGLAFCTDTGKSIVVQWLCVAGKHRRQGVGEHLLAAVYDAAVELNYTTVYAYINKLYGRELICAGEEEYLRDRLFKAVIPLAGEWITNICTLQKNPLLKGKTELENIKAVPLHTLPLKEKGQALKFLAQKKYAAYIYPAEDNMKCLDMDVSCLLYKDGRLSGGLLIQSVERITTKVNGNTILNYKENILYPVFMCIESATGITALINMVLKKAAEKYATDSEIHILMNKGQYASLMERMLPDSRIDNMLLAASVEDYKKQEENFELQMLLSLG